MQKSEGWAVTHEGVIDVRSISNTRRGAIVNWLYTRAGYAILDRYTDLTIEKMWDQAVARYKVEAIEVTIEPKRSIK